MEVKFYEILHFTQKSRTNNLDPRIRMDSIIKLVQMNYVRSVWTNYRSVHFLT